MRYTVTALPDARDELARIWIAAADRGAVARASDAIDARLKWSPLAGTPGPDDSFTLTIPPLTVVYTVSSDDRLVTILQYLD